MPASDAYALVEYVYDRPKGLVPQEIGGAYLTLAVLSASIYENLDACGEAELARCWEKIDKIRQKQANKPKGALPQ